MKNRIADDCGRMMAEKDSHLTDLSLDANYHAILQLIRLYMQSVSHPESMAWMAALANADETFGRVFGPQIASCTLDVLQHMRLSRRSMFCFNSPICPSCCQIVTGHERRFMVALCAMRQEDVPCARDMLRLFSRGWVITAIVQARLSLVLLLEAPQIKNHRPAPLTSPAVS